MTSEAIKWNFSSYTDNKGRTYIISYYNRWDPVKKQSRVAKRIHVGRLNADTGEVSLSKSFLEANPDYVCEHVFYESNALVIRTEEDTEAINQEVQDDLSWRCDCVSFGLTYACWEVAKQSGILFNLKSVFGEEDGAELIRLAIYQLCSHSMAMQNYEDWLSMNYLPKASPLSSQKISTILAKVNQENIDQYFKLRHDRVVKDHIKKEEEAKKLNMTLPPMMMAIDSTSISTWSESIDNAAFGHAKQDDFLKQVNLTFCIDYFTGDLCYAYESEGSVNDMSLFADILLRMQNVGLDLSKTLLTTDRGYASILNIQKLINCHLLFLTGISLKEDSVKATIDRYKPSLNNPMFMNGKLGIYARTADTEKWTSTSDGVSDEKKVFLHLYHDAALGERQTIALMRDLQDILDKKKANTTVDKNVWKKYSGFFVQNTKTHEWSLNSTKVQNACRYHGYFAIRTNTIEDPFQSLVIYRERNIVESAFRQFKVLNESDRMYATGTSYKGKLFIYMLAQTIRMMMCVCAFNHKPDGKVLPGDSFDKAMLQMQKLQATRPAGRGIYIVKEIPKKTRDLFETFKISFPKKQIKD